MTLDSSNTPMALDVNRFAELRPFVFHLTGRENIGRIRAASALDSAAAFLSASRCTHLLSLRRRGHQVVGVGAHRVVLRDQDPLHEGAIAFETDWDLPRFVAHVNEHVFFWPGSATGPVAAG